VTADKVDSVEQVEVEARAGMARRKKEGPHHMPVVVVVVVVVVARNRGANNSQPA
jgi:hypothetical protein